jgi:hypothetical protein
MTNKEALIRGVLGQFTIDDFQADKVLLDAEISGAGTYSPSNSKALDECALEILHTMCIQSMSEGGFSVSFNRQAVEGMIGQLSTKLGVPNPLTPTIKGSSAW